MVDSVLRIFTKKAERNLQGGGLLEQEICAAQEPCLWRAKLFQSYNLDMSYTETSAELQAEREEAIKIGEIVRIKHEETTSYLGTTELPVSVLLPLSQTEVLKTGKVQQEEQLSPSDVCDPCMKRVGAKHPNLEFEGISTCWEVVGVKTRGGKLENNSEVRLKNLASGLFLEFKQQRPTLRESGTSRACSVTILNAETSHQELLISKSASV